MPINLDFIVNGVDRSIAATNSIENSFTELQSGVMLAQEALAAAKGAYDSVIQPTLDLSDHVRRLNTDIGATPEEASKLIYATGAMGVSTDTLTVALDAAIKRGHQPTIANLATMSDEYNRIQDPIARTKFLEDEFGKSGVQLGEFMKLGGAGIQALGDQAVTTGNVLSGPDVQAAHDWELSLNELEATAKGLGNTLAVDLLPGLTGFAKQESTNALAIEIMNKQVAAGALSRAEMVAWTAQIVVGLADTNKFVEQNSNWLRDNSVTARTLRDDWDALTVAKTNYANEDQPAEWDRRIAAAAGYGQQLSSGVVATHNLIDARAQDIASAQADIASAQAIGAANSQMAVDVQAATVKSSLAYEGLEQSLSHLTTANLASQAIAQLQAQIKADPGNADAYQKAIDQIGIKAGLLTPQGIAAASALTALGSALNTHKIDPEQYATALDRIPTAVKNGVEPSLKDLGLDLDPKKLHFEDARKSGEDFGTSLTALANTHVSAAQLAMDDQSGLAHTVSKLNDWLGSAGLPMTNMGTGLDTLVTGHVSPANRAIDSLGTSISNLPSSKTITITTIYVTKHQDIP